MYIYKTTNNINNKIYIGQTSKPTDSNYLGSGHILLKAISKYGSKNFTREIIEECNSKEQMNEREKYWISYYSSNTRDIGYNISVGGTGGNLGEEVNKRISEGLIRSGASKGNQHRKGKAPYNKGVPMTEAQKEKMRKPKSEEHKLALSKARKGVYYKSIICLTNDKIYPGSSVAAEELGLTAPNIIAVLKGRAKATKGYVFKYC